MTSDTTKAVLALKIRPHHSSGHLSWFHNMYLFMKETLLVSTSNCTIEGEVLGAGEVKLGGSFTQDS